MLEPLRVLLDQNVSREVAQWLRTFRPQWTVHHTSEVGLQGKSDESIFRWAQQDGSLIITFDEDFADRRAFPLSQHHGVVRLRVWPTTIEETQRALERLFAEVAGHELSGALVIVDRTRIRVRPQRRARP